MSPGLKYWRVFVLSFPRPDKVCDDQLLQSGADSLLVLERPLVTADGGNSFGPVANQGIENIATSGIRIYTSLNKEIQEGALRSIRTHLPLLDVKLSGYRTNVAVEKYNESSD